MTKFVNRVEDDKARIALAQVFQVLVASLTWEKEKHQTSDK